MIRLDSVTKVYRGVSRPALDAVSLEIGSGEFVFLVGASGSGKSTLLRLMLREEKPSNGEIHVLGQRLTSISSRKVPLFRRNLGVVFQDFRLLPNKTVYDNVAFTLQVIGKSRGFIQEAVPDVLRMVGLAEKASRLPNELSGGEQQRVAIARAVVNKPKILLADEPTGNLDPATSLEIMAVLEQINLSGTTVVMATHDVSIVDRLHKRVIEVEGGHIVRDELEGAYVTTAVPVQAAPLPDSASDRRPAWARGSASGRMPEPQPRIEVPTQYAPTPVYEAPSYEAPVYEAPAAEAPVVAAPAPAPVVLEPAAAAPSPFEAALAAADRRASAPGLDPEPLPTRSSTIVTGAATSAWSLFAAPEEPAARPSVIDTVATAPAHTSPAEPDHAAQAAADDPTVALRARMEAAVLHAAPPWAAPPTAESPATRTPEPANVDTGAHPDVHPGLDDWQDGPTSTAPPSIENAAAPAAEAERPAARAWFDAARAVPLPASALPDERDRVEPQPYRRTFPREMLDDTGVVTMPGEPSEAEKAVRTFTGPIDLGDPDDPDSLARRYGKHRVELPAHLDFVAGLGLRDESAESSEEVGPSS